MENVHVKITLMRTSVLPVNPLILFFQAAKVANVLQKVQLMLSVMTKDNVIVKKDMEDCNVRNLLWEQRF